MDFRYETIKNDCVTPVAQTQTVVNCEVSTADRGGAAKLLSVGTDILVYSVETVEGKARVSGKVTYKIIYVDREDKLNGLDYYGDFDVAVEDAAITAQAAQARATVLNAECQMAGDILRLSAVCDIRICQIVSHEDKALVEAQCENRTEQIQTTTLQPIAETAFELVEEAPSGHNVDRVLLFDAHAIRVGQSGGVDSTTIEGMLYADVVYLSQGEVQSQQIAAPFSEELDLVGDVDITLTLKSARLVLTGEDDDNILRVEAVLAITGYRVENIDQTVVRDVFCPDSETVPHMQCFVCRTPIGHYSHTHTLNAQLGTADFRRAVAGYVSRVNVANLLADTGAITAEGLAVVSVLYEDADARLTATQIEIPFSVTLNAAEVTADCYITGGAIGMQTQIGPRGDVQIQLLLAADAYRPRKVCYVTDIDQTPYCRKQAVASVYFAQEGESVWDIAHAVHLAPSQLLAQNPQLEQPIEGKRRVLVFRHRDLD